MPHKGTESTYFGVGGFPRSKLTVFPNITLALLSPVSFLLMHRAHFLLCMWTHSSQTTLDIEGRLSCQAQKPCVAFDLRISPGSRCSEGSEGLGSSKTSTLCLNSMLISGIENSECFYFEKSYVKSFLLERSHLWYKKVWFVREPIS